MVKWSSRLLMKAFYCMQPGQRLPDRPELSLLTGRRQHCELTVCGGPGLCMSFCLSHAGIILIYVKKKLNSLKRLVRTTVAMSHN